MNTSDRKLNKVVFVDDNPMTNQYHQLLWKETPFANGIEFYQNAESALDALNSMEDYPELIFIDINMPRMDGHEFISILNQTEKYLENKPVLAYLTSSKDIRDVVQADENEVTNYYWKPLNKKTLAEALKKDLFGIEL